MVWTKKLGRYIINRDLLTGGGGGGGGGWEDFQIEIGADVRARALGFQRSTFVRALGPCR